MGMVGGVARTPAVGTFAGGVAMQLVNAITSRVKLPIVPRGDVFEPRGTDAQAGAALVDRLLGALGFISPPVDARTTLGPLLGTTRVMADGSTSVRVSFTAAAPGSSWAVKGRESAVVAVYVDGTYHSDVMVMRERPGSYAVNVGQLAAGAHRIELRSGASRAAAGSGTVMVGNVGARRMSRAQTEIDRHAPILQLRDALRAGGTAESSHTDTPLLVVPSVRQNANGTRTISYHVLFSNEDGGTATPTLFSKYGRGTDYELAYSVTLDKAGKRIASKYQGPMHRNYAFTGRYEGDRPVLRVATANNNFSQVTHAGAARWSEAPQSAVSPTTTDTQVMHRHPWTFGVMAAELLREGRATTAAVPGLSQVGDPRRYLYVSPAGTPSGVSAAARGARQLVLILKGGKRIVLNATVAGLAAGRSTAIMLPSAAFADAVVGVAGLANGVAHVLGTTFAPRRLRAA